MQKPKICFDKIDKNSVSWCMSRKCIDVVWKFNVPANPHAGGNWERAIRTVKMLWLLLYTIALLD